MTEPDAFVPATLEDVRADVFARLARAVKDRPRLTGVSNYGFFDRLWVGIGDLMGVAWLCRRRRKIAQVKEVTDHAG